MIGELQLMSNEKKNFINRSKFSMMVEDSVIQHNHGYMDAIILLCEENSMELSDVKKYLSPSIVAKLEVEAVRLNFIQGDDNFTPLE